MEWLTKAECNEGNSGKAPSERSVGEFLEQGFIVLDKWSGPTSRDAVFEVKKLLGPRIAGHAGTLDPAVSGVLVITLGRGCKLISILQAHEKEYVGIMRLHKNVDKKKIRRVLKEFVGTIRQKPPVRSAVARRVRERDIFEIEILDIAGRDVCLRVRCSAGTYIRKLFHDIGEKLDVGAQMSELRRIRSGYFGEERAVPMQVLSDAWRTYEKGDETEIRKILLPIEDALVGVKKIKIKDSAISSVRNGSPIFTRGICGIQPGILKNDKVAIMSQKEELVALGSAKMSGSEILHKEGLAVKIERVI